MVSTNIFAWEAKMDIEMMSVNELEKVDKN